MSNNFNIIIKPPVLKIGGNGNEVRPRLSPQERSRVERVIDIKRSYSSLDLSEDSPKKFATTLPSVTRKKKSKRKRKKSTHSRRAKKRVEEYGGEVENLFKIRSVEGERKKRGNHKRLKKGFVYSPSIDKKLNSFEFINIQSPKPQPKSQNEFQSVNQMEFLKKTVVNQQKSIRKKENLIRKLKRELENIPRLKKRLESSKRDLKILKEKFVKVSQNSVETSLYLDAQKKMKELEKQLNYTIKSKKDLRSQKCKIVPVLLRSRGNTPRKKKNREPEVSVPEKLTEKQREIKKFVNITLEDDTLLEKRKERDKKINRIVNNIKETPLIDRTESIGTLDEDFLTLQNDLKDILYRSNEMRSKIEREIFRKKNSTKSFSYVHVDFIKDLLKELNLSHTDMAEMRKVVKRLNRKLNFRM